METTTCRREDLPSILLGICLALAGFISMLYQTEAPKIDLWGVPFVVDLAILGMLILLCQTGTVEKWHVWVILGVVCATIGGMLLVIHDIHFMAFGVLACASTAVVMTGLYLTRPLTTPDYALVVILLGASLGSLGNMCWRSMHLHFALPKAHSQTHDTVVACVSGALCLGIVAYTLVMARRNPPRIPEVS